MVFVFKNCFSKKFLKTLRITFCFVCFEKMCYVLKNKGKEKKKNTHN